MAISVHPDDETLGCGGSLLRHGSDGDQLHWLIITQAHSPTWTTEVIERKAAEVHRVAEAYRMGSVQRLGFPTTMLDTIPLSDLIDGVRAAISRVRPQVLYLPHFGDIHTDHAATVTASMCVLKTFHMLGLGVRRVLSYESLSSTEAAPSQSHRVFLPTVYCDISPYIEQKLRIMEMYSTEVQADPLPRGPTAIRALARYRGAAAAVDYAEAFALVREII